MGMMTRPIIPNSEADAEDHDLKVSLGKRGLNSETGIKAGVREREGKWKVTQQVKTSAAKPDNQN